MNERSVRITQQGGPEVMTFVEEALPPPGPGEVQMRNTAIGLNFIDIYHRSGLYPIPLPSGLGVEAAGVVEAVGEGVTDFREGDRVSTFGPQLGAYATARNVPAAALFDIPDAISDETAAAALLKACTAEALVERCARVQPRWPVLVHAAAGGVGLILTQWLKHKGAVVIGTVSTDEKAALAREAGADHIILAPDENIATRVRDVTEGKGVRVVFDGVGQSTWEASLASIMPRGMIVSYGNASGAVTNVALASLSAAGSIFVTRPTLFHYYKEPEERTAGSEYVFDMIANGAIGVSVNQRYALADVAQAHRDLAARKTSGSSVLQP